MLKILNRKSVKAIMAGLGALAFVLVCWIYESYVSHGGNITSAHEIFSNVQPLKFICMFGLFLMVFTLLLASKTRDLVFKYRFVLAGLFFLLCLIPGIHGSSVGYYDLLFGIVNGDVKMGASRGIRVDEWATLTPMTFSQYHNPDGAFSYFNSLVRGEPTDVFIEYGLPVASLITIYRPFYIGYILFPIAQGLAFFWYGRLIALFLVSFEFARLLTKDNRRLSLMYALAITFAPAVQWWFAINGFVEMLIDVQLAIIIFDKFLLCNNSKKRIFYTAIIVLCAGSFILTMYPAWMIPMAYVLLGLIIWIFIKNHKLYKINKIDILTIAVGVILLALSMGYVFMKSADTITAMMNTAYPGKRFETGGGMAKWMATYIFPMWYSIGASSPYMNVCEASFFMDFFPLPYIFFIYLLAKKKTNSLLWIMMALSIFFGIWGIFGFPAILAKVTFMSMVLKQRAIDIFCLVNVIMLFMEASIIHAEKKKSILLTLVSLLGVMAMAVLQIKLYPDYLTTGQTLVTFLVFALLTFGFTLQTERVSKWWACLFGLVMLLTGAFVNPVSMGVNSIENIPSLLAAEHVNELDPGETWAVMDCDYPYTNSLLIKGIKTLNSTNVYPDLARWQIIDPDKQYEDIYNRYAHVNMYLVADANDKDKFELAGTDFIYINATYQDLKDLNITYIFTRTVLTETDRYDLVGAGGDWKIYKVK